MDAIYTASQSVRLLHKVAGWAGHTWGNLPEDDVIGAVLRAADRGELTPEGIQAAINAACYARLTPGVKGWGICCPEANPGGDPDVLAVPIGSAVVVHTRIGDARGQYTYHYAHEDGFYAVRFALDDYGVWRVQSFATSGTARKRDIFRAGVVLAQAGMWMPGCDDNLRQAVAEEYAWPELATRPLADIGPGILAAPG